MIYINEVKDITEGAKGTPTGTRITFFESKDEPLEYIGKEAYVGFADENNDWFVFKVVTRTKSSNSTNITYEARFLGSSYDASKVFDKIDIEETEFVNITNETIIETSIRRACQC